MTDKAYRTKMLGVVTLYNPDPEQAAANIRRYVPDVDKLVVWDNSPLEKGLQPAILRLLGEQAGKVVWQGNGQNRCIAKAINYAWQLAQEQGFDLLLLMDQDSSWADFPAYRTEIESIFCEGKLCAFTPYVPGNDTWAVTEKVQQRRLFINSGTVIPVYILNALNGADEAFPLDALDYDLALRILKRGYSTVCLTSCILHHTLGSPKRSPLLKLYTPDYGEARTYSIVYSHLLNYRKNRKWMTANERRRELKEFLFWKFVRIVLAEQQKWSRMKMYFKGVRDGLRFDLSQTKP